MKSSELEKLLRKHGCTFQEHRGGSGHVTVHRGDKKTAMPRHGSGHEIGSKLLHKILKDLDLKGKL